MRPSVALRHQRQAVLAAARRFRMSHPRVFGSVLHGTDADGSDLDLLVVMHSDLPRHKRATQIRLLFNPTPCPMDVLVVTPEEVKHWNGTVNLIVTEALERGVVAFEKPGTRTGKAMA